ncbi:MAG: patatin-like phospholipase RssA [Sulfuritalea sp.]|jgi:NTE family protein|nr:patatin-like phospholipase RssA [Sulfuritalea sp.]MDP1985565.1 patatin-like phospholipase RssA [Sulfuritalea sp.]
MKPKLGLALGSGSARGWAHIGVIRELEKAGYVPDVVAGCSIGAFIGAAYADGDLDPLEAWVKGLAWKEVLSLLDVSFSGGLFKGEKLVAFFQRHFVDKDFASLPMPFSCVATDLATGREIWLREGSVASAVRASIAVPGLFTPVVRDGRLLVDGGLVNPVPVSLCRAMGADIVIAVDLGSDRVGSSLRHKPAAEIGAAGREPRWAARMRKTFSRPRQSNGELLPSMAGVMTTGIHIMQMRIARSRLAGEPADVLLAPRLGHLALMDYHRGSEAIEEGRAAVIRMLPSLEHALSA